MKEVKKIESFSKEPETIIEEEFKNEENIEKA